MLILVLIHRRLERCLVKVKINRNFSTLYILQPIHHMKKILITVFVNASFFMAAAQQTHFIADPQTSLKEAKEYFQRGDYSLAYPLFKDLNLYLREADRSDKAISYQEIQYYTIVCALKQNEATAT